MLCRQETTARPPTGLAWAGAHQGRRKAEVIIITRVLAYLSLILYIPVELSSAVETSASMSTVVSETHQRSTDRTGYYYI